MKHTNEIEFSYAHFFRRRQRRAKKRLEDVEDQAKGY